MPFYKTIAILLVAAIANPLCCCFAAFSGQEQAVEQAMVEHACCSKDHGQQQTSTSEKKSHQDCPHQLEKESQISQAADSFDSQLIPHLFILANLAQYLETLAPAPLANSYPNYEAPEQTIAAPPLLQGYCVYLI